MFTDQLATGPCGMPRRSSTWPVARSTATLATTEVEHGEPRSREQGQVDELDHDEVGLAAHREHGLDAVAEGGDPAEAGEHEGDEAQDPRRGEQAGLDELVDVDQPLPSL